MHKLLDKGLGNCVPLGLSLLSHPKALHSLKSAGVERFGFIRVDF